MNNFPNIDVSRLVGKLLITQRDWYDTEEEYVRCKERHANLRIDAAQVCYSAHNAISSYYNELRNCALNKEETREILINLVDGICYGTEAPTVI